MKLSSAVAQREHAHVLGGDQLAVPVDPHSHLQSRHEGRHYSTHGKTLADELEWAPAVDVLEHELQLPRNRRSSGSRCRESYSACASCRDEHQAERGEDRQDPRSHRLHPPRFYEPWGMTCHGGEADIKPTRSKIRATSQINESAAAIRTSTCHTGQFSSDPNASELFSE